MSGPLWTLVGPGNPHAGHRGAELASLSGPVDGVLAALVRRLTVTGIHTLPMVVVAGAIAVLICRVVGLAILHSAWVNLDKIWAVTLVGSGASHHRAGLIRPALHPPSRFDSRTLVPIAGRRVRMSAG